MSKKLYIIHGWTYTIQPWEKTVEILKNQGVDVVQLRVPGLTSPSQGVWTVASYVEWLKEQIADSGDFAVLGHSNGGRIAMNLLIKYPNYFPNLILLNSAGIYYPKETQSSKRKTARSLAKIGKPLAKIPGLRKIFYRLIGSDYGRAPENMKKTLSNMLESDKHFDPKRVRAGRVSILWGKEDKVTPLGMGEKLHEGISGSTFRSFDEWAHAPYISHPEELAEAIMEELR